MLAAVGIVLLVACAMCHLQFTRASSRRSELADSRSTGRRPRQNRAPDADGKASCSPFWRVAGLLFAKLCLWLCVSEAPYVVRLWAGFDKIVWIPERCSSPWQSR